jgi:co-chaperonin GroES (HSP10)
MLHIKKIKPLFTSIVTTGNKYEEDMRDNGIIVANKGDLKLYQTVIAVGSTVRDIQVGDTVMIDPKNYAVMKYDANSIKNDMDMNKVVKWNMPWIILDDENGKPQDCLYLSERDIKFVFEGEETNDSIIIPDKPSLILN